MLLAGGFLVHPGAVEHHHRQGQWKAFASFGSHHPAAAFPGSVGIDLVHLAVSADHPHGRVVQLAVQWRRSEQSERLAGQNREQCRSADNLAGPQVGAQSSGFQRGGILETQPVQGPV